MGAISGEELKRLEKMQSMSGHEEKILVLVRLRPLSEKEITSNEVADWECLNDSTILYRNTLREGSTFPSAYTFDKVFPGDCSTNQVYEDGAKEIALSVVSGINSSVFAYGQTSSGKTYTMTGITEYTAADIFDYVHRHEERAFVLKFSAIEIYNEAVRDLLSSDSTPLRLRDDPERGTIVEKVTEENLRDWNHLKELLSTCEAQRRVGETSLNEKSSRSHQIIRLTIESSAREFLGKGNSTTLSASVNFVDLAGSERASQASSVGARLKEGCHINRSLLTLGTVIRKLSKGRHGHINYRDSKLTRILQSSLGGNARTVIVCTLSPARGHVEQTRNTLLFACCAKEVTTKAQVNVVMSDKALVKQLQKELARLESELRSPAPASSICDYPTLLRKKDIQIQKLEKEVKELSRQRDLAQSRVDNLLKTVAVYENSKEQFEISVHPNETMEDTYDSSHCSDVRNNNLNNTHHYGIKSGSNLEDSYSKFQENHEDSYLSDGTSSFQFLTKSAFRSDSIASVEETAASDDHGEYCKEVQCIEMDESSSRENKVVSHDLSSSQNEEMSPQRNYRDGDGDETSAETRSSPLNGDRNLNYGHDGYGALEQRFHNVKRTIDSLVSPYPDEVSFHPWATDMSSSRSLKLSRSWSCRANFMTGSSTPPDSSEKNFPGRPERLQRNFTPLHYDPSVAKLSRSDSVSSLGSSSIDDLRAHNVKTSADENITSIHSFVAGMKEMAKHHGQVQEAAPNDNSLEKNVKDVGLNAMQVTVSYLPEEFERQRRQILEHWQSCNVSLVHRTYFFLLFKGDPSDSIYMEVEIRRLSFLKENSHGNQSVDNNLTLALASSTKALRRERETLSKLLGKRFSGEERKRLYEKWGIRLESRRRRLQLANLLWSNTKDMNHVTESATIVAKLIRFVEQGHALKEMFGLSFTPLRLKRRSLGWKNSMASLF